MKNFTKYIICLLLMVISNINAQELEPNGNFDSDINGWHCGNGSPTWISDDGSPTSGNGSLQHTFSFPNANGGTLGAGYCDFSAADAGNTYVFKGSYKLLNNDEVTNLDLNLYFYTQDETYIDVFTHLIPFNSITLNQWTKFSITALAPANTAKIISDLSFGFSESGNPVNMVIHWDDMSLKDNAIFDNGFE